MLLQDVEAYLNTFGAYSSGGTTFTMRRNFLPDTPEAVIVLMEFGAGAPVRAMGASVGAPVRERAGLQVMVRGPLTNYDAARAVAETVHQRLDHYFGTLSGRQYSIQAMHAPQLKEQDRERRWLIEANYQVMKERG